MDTGRREALKRRIMRACYDQALRRELKRHDRAVRDIEARRQKSLQRQGGTG